jgi:hypothetical protein
MSMLDVFALNWYHVMFALNSLSWVLNCCMMSTIEKSHV